jgi:hypothetical protein
MPIPFPSPSDIILPTSGDARLPTLTRRTQPPALAFKPVAAALLLALALSAQTPTPPPYTLRARVPLTIVDVTVTDAQGHPVHNLPQSAFTLLEDNHEMKLFSFEEHRTDQVPPPEPTPLTLPPNTFTNATPATTTPTNRPLNILLLDNLNTPAQMQQQVTQRMLDFVAPVSQTASPTKWAP